MDYMKLINYFMILISVCLINTNAQLVSSEGASLILKPTRPLPTTTSTRKSFFEDILKQKTLKKNVITENFTDISVENNQTSIDQVINSTPSVSTTTRNSVKNAIYGQKMFGRQSFIKNSFLSTTKLPEPENVTLIKSTSNIEPTLEISTSTQITVNTTLIVEETVNNDFILTSTPSSRVVNTTLEVEANVIATSKQPSTTRNEYIKGILGRNGKINTISSTPAIEEPVTTLHPVDLEMLTTSFKNDSTSFDLRMSNETTAPVNESLNSTVSQVKTSTALIKQFTFDPFSTTFKYDDESITKSPIQTTSYEPKIIETTTAEIEIDRTDPAVELNKNTTNDYLMTTTIDLVLPSPTDFMNTTVASVINSVENITLSTTTKKTIIFEPVLKKYRFCSLFYSGVVCKDTLIAEKNDNDNDDDDDDNKNDKNPDVDASDIDIDDLEDPLEPSIPYFNTLNNDPVRFSLFFRGFLKNFQNFDDSDK